MTPISARPTAKSKAGENERNGGRQNDGFENLPFRSAETSRRGEQVRRRSFDAVAGVDQERKNRAQENDADLGQNADTQPNDDQRQERDARSGVHRVDERVANVGKSLIPADGNAERYSEDDRQEITPGKLDAANIEVVIDFARSRKAAMPPLPISDGALMNIGLISRGCCRPVSQTA